MTMSNDMALSAQACVVLAQIEPDGQQVVPCFRRFLAAVERDSPINPRTGVREVIFDAFWQLRSNAQPLAVDLRRMVLSSPMRTRRDRCHAAFALASFPDERAAALGYLESISAHEYGYGDGYLANEILAKIKEKLRQPVAVSSD
jgi:hypothetical protein